MRTAFRKNKIGNLNVELQSDEADVQKSNEKKVCINISSEKNKPSCDRTLLDEYNQKVIFEFFISYSNIKLSFFKPFLKMLLYGYVCVKKSSHFKAYLQVI